MKFDLLTGIIIVWVLCIIFTAFNIFTGDLVADMDNIIAHSSKPLELKNWHFGLLLGFIWLSGR